MPLHPGRSSQHWLPALARPAQLMGAATLALKCAIIVSLRCALPATTVGMVQAEAFPLHTCTVVSPIGTATGSRRLGLQASPVGLAFPPTLRQAVLPLLAARPAPRARRARVCPSAAAGYGKQQVTRTLQIRRSGLPADSLQQVLGCLCQPQTPAPATTHTAAAGRRLRQQTYTARTWSSKVTTTRCMVMHWRASECWQCSRHDERRKQCWLQPANKSICKTNTHYRGQW